MSKERPTESAASSGEGRAESGAPRRGWRSRIWRFVKWTFLSIVAVVGTYLVVIGIGLIPVNNGFKETPGGVKLVLTADALHIGLALPLSNDIIDWREEFPDTLFEGDVAGSTYVEFGWGDRNFCINTPTWDDMTVGSTLNALFMPTETCIHVVMKREGHFPADSRTLEISEDEYREMVEYIKQSFKLADGQRIEIPGGAHNDHDVYFESSGSYHFLNTCNNWVGGALKKSGIKTPFFAPLPKTPFWYLPE